MKYKFRWSAMTKILTTLYLICVGLLLYFTYPYDNIWLIGIDLFVVGLTLYFIAICPRYMVVTEEGIKLVTLLSGSRFYAWRDHNVSDKGRLKESKSIRVWGTGGFMGFTGWFYKKEYGRYFLYATDENSPTILLTPKDGTKKTMIGGLSLSEISTYIRK